MFTEEEKCFHINLQTSQSTALRKCNSICRISLAYSKKISAKLIVESILDSSQFPRIFFPSPTTVMKRNSKAERFSSNNHQHPFADAFPSSGLLLRRKWNSVSFPFVWQKNEEGSCEMLRIVIFLCLYRFNAKEKLKHTHITLNLAIE